MPITSNNANITTMAKLAISAANGTTPNRAIEWTQRAGGKVGSVMDTGGTRGSLSHRHERTRNGASMVEYSFTTEPSFNDVAALLPLILGGSSSPFVTPENVTTLPYFSLFESLGVQEWTYAGCKFDSATFTFSQGSFLSLSLGLRGKSATAGTVSGLSALAVPAETPFICEDSTCSIDGSNYEIKAFSLTVSNNLLVRFANSLTPTDIKPVDLAVAWQLALPYNSDTTGVYNAINATGADISLTMNNGTNTINF